MLLSIPRSRWIFTNSDRDHAERVLRNLGIGDCFDGMVDVYAMDPYCKPKREAYQLALQLSGATDPKYCALLDDSINNLTEAKKIGFFTVLVGQIDTDSSADRTLQSIINLPNIVPEFWE
jgi:pyrimidine 5'-nucleotidase